MSGPIFWACITTVDETYNFLRDKSEMLIFYLSLKVFILGLKESPYLIMQYKPGDILRSTLWLHSGKACYWCLFYDDHFSSYL